MKKKLLLFMFLAFSIVGCKEPLYSGLDERQANQMLTVLAKAGIRTTKKNIGKGLFDILVSSDDLSDAVTILNVNGLPNDKFASMEDIYKKDGLISSPMEERIRYMFALSQSLSETLTNIDGVVVARVHIAVPEVGAIGSKKKPNSASIFIKHTDQFSHKNAMPDIKRVLEKSVEGLNYQDVSIFLSEVDTSEHGGALGRNSANQSNNGTVLVLTVMIITMGLFIIGFMIWIMYACDWSVKVLVSRLKKLRKKIQDKESTVVTAFQG